MNPGKAIQNKINGVKQNFADYKKLDSRDKKTYWKEFLLNNALYILLIVAIIYTYIQNSNFLSAASIVNIISLSAANLPAIKVNISEEGLRALHGSKMKGSVDIQKQMEEMQYISEHQPVESFTNRLSRVMQNSYVQFFESNSDEKLTIQKKADVLLGEFKSICDEINSGYDGGTRVRFIEDSTSTDGFRKLSKDDELSILLSEFSNFVEGRFGKTHQEESEKVAKIVNDLQKVKQEMGRGDIRYYEPEYIPSDFVEKLLKAASDYIKA